MSKRTATFMIMKPAKTFAGVNYSEKKNREGKSELIEAINFGYLADKEGVSKADYVNYLEKWSSSSSRTQKKQFHAVISTEGKTLTHEQLAVYAKELMRELGYGDCPMLLYAHHDTPNNHIHIVTSRIGKDGKKIDSANEGRRAMNMLDKILGIERSQQLAIALAEVKKYRYSTIAQWKMLLENKGVGVSDAGTDFKLYKQGTSKLVDKQEITKSLYMSPGLKNENLKTLLLEKSRVYDTRLITRKELNENAKPAYGRELTSKLAEHLRQHENIELLFHRAKDSVMPYGYTIIDHSEQAVYKGSEIMRMNELLGIDEPGLVRSDDQGRGEASALDNLIGEFMQGISDVGTASSTGTEREPKRKKRKRR